ncbi:MAG: HAD-IIIA family hydrolase [Candidatus Thermoplasmatota archaeon]|nr:HAD-IIIA family hydrolase [Candidatus Thermoplasmatota archaeon]
MDGPIAHALRPFAGGCKRAPIAFLDRDGVLNMSLDGYVNHPHELELLRGTERAMRRLRDEGFLLCVVTNQSAVGRGVWDDERLHQIHDRFDAMLAASGAQPDLILACPHVPWAGCGCRKPKTGMLSLGASLLRSEHGFGVLRQRMNNVEAPSIIDDVMVGDRGSDIRAGLTFGARTFLAVRDLGLESLLARLVDRSDPGDEVR